MDAFYTGAAIFFVGALVYGLYLVYASIRDNSLEKIRERNEAQYAALPGFTSDMVADHATIGTRIAAARAHADHVRNRAGLPAYNYRYL